MDGEWQFPEPEYSNLDLEVILKQAVDMSLCCPRERPATKTRARSEESVESSSAVSLPSNFQGTYGVVAFLTGGLRCAWRDLRNRQWSVTIRAF